MVFNFHFFLNKFIGQMHDYNHDTRTIERDLLKEWLKRDLCPKTQNTIEGRNMTINLRIKEPATKTVEG